MKIDVYRWIELELNATIQTLNDDLEEADKKRNKILKDVFTGAESRIILKQFVFWNNKYINYKRQREHLEDSLRSFEDAKDEWYNWAPNNAANDLVETGEP